MKKKIIKYMTIPTRFNIDERYDTIGKGDNIRILKNKEWDNWNYKVGHNKFIKDNNDIITFMSHAMKPENNDIIMIYNPSLYNNFVTKKNESYCILPGTIDIYQYNEINIEKSN